MGPEKTEVSNLDLAQAFTTVKGLPFVKLSGPNNFRQWKNDMETLCRMVNVNFDEMEKLSSHNKDVMLRLLNLFIDTDLRNELLDFSSPDELIEEVTAKYSSTSLITRIKLQKSLYQLSKEPEESMVDLISRLNTLCRSLKGMNVVISEKDKIIILLGALPDKYESFISSISEKDSYNTISQRLKALDELPSSKVEVEQSVFYSNKHSLIICRNCGGKGHTFKQCPSKREYKKLSVTSNMYKSHGNQVNYVNDNENPIQEEALMTCLPIDDLSSDDEVEWALSAKGVNFKENNVDTAWFLDSGATVHLCRNSKLLSNLIPIKPVPIMVANGQYIQCKWSGQVIISGISIESVYYHPDLAANLISMVKLKEITKMFIENEDICFRQNNLVIRTKQVNKNIIIVTDCLENKAFSAYKVSPEIWHERLMHIADKELAHYTGLHMNKKCVACSLAKIPRSPHPLNNTAVTRPLELVYFDLAGKISPRGLDGEEYYCIALDEYSKATQIIPLKSKANALQAVKQIISLWESLVGKSVERVRTDHGTEFKNVETSNYFARKEIVKEWSCVGTPQQISVERYNRYVKENVSTIIINRRLPKNTWSLICTSVPYVKNRIRSSATMMEPMKLLGLKFTIDHLRCIGCMVVYKKDKDIKMDMKGNIGVFLAYGPKNSYKVLDVATNCIKVTSNVKFYEEYDYIDAQMFYKRLVLHETKIPAHINDIDDLDNIPSSYSLKSITSGNVCENSKIMTSEINDKNIIEDSSTNDIINKIPYELKEDILNLSHKFEEFIVSDDNVISKTQSDYIRNPKFVNGSPVATRTRKKGSAFFVTSPSGYLEASQLPEWKESMKQELESLIKNNTWTYVKKNDIGKQNVITSKWVYNVKNDGRLKSRLTARGCQQPTQSETYSPTVHPSILKAILSICMQTDMKVHTMDCTNAFLQGNFEDNEIIYMTVPKGIELVHPQHTNSICRLLKPIYGLRQSSRCWYKTFTDFLTIDANFIISEFDSCVLFTYNPSLIIILLYVDDIMIISQSDTVIEKLKQRILSRFEAKDYGPMIEHTEYIGLEFAVKNNEIIVNQEMRIKKLIEEYSSLCLVPKKNIIIPKGEVVESDYLNEKQHSDFRKIVGKLSYISNLSRPDITFSVNYLQRVLEKPRKCHLSIALNIISYLMKFPDLSIHFKKSKHHPLEVYCDASYASSKDAHSTTGIIIMVYGAPVYWATKKQSTISLSSSEAEVKAAVEAVKQMLWIKKIFQQIFNKLSVSPVLFVDNIPAINIMKNNEISNAKMRHTNINLSFLKEMRNNFKYVVTSEQLADGLTKIVSTDKLHRLFGYDNVNETEEEM
uniref:Retrovirus-related Pol polyprotein from transposon TNT 1-94 n=1 Tax=Strongyloides venezuelensis TaxID=75913 RepID=A0A0K0FQ44_STRVS